MAGCFSARWSSGTAQHRKPEEGRAWGFLSLTWGATDHRFRSLFIKQQVMVARTLAPVTRATPVPTNRGTNRVSTAGEKEDRLCSESVMVPCLPSHWFLNILPCRIFRLSPPRGRATRHLCLPTTPTSQHFRPAWVPSCKKMWKRDSKGRQEDGKGQTEQQQVGRGWLSLTMRVGVDCDRPGARTACLVPAVVSMLHPGTWGTVVYAFVLGPQAVQS